MVISFPFSGTGGLQDPAAVQTSAPLAQLRAYWEALRDGGLPPHRSAIDPRGIEAALGGAFILERVAPGVTRFRIAGSLIADLTGCDPRGMPLSVLFEPRARADLPQKIDQVFSGPAMLEMRTEAERGLGRPALAAQIMILPLRNEAGLTELALGAIALTGEPGRRARRFALAGCTVTPLQTGKPAPAKLLAETQAEGFAEPAVLFTAAITRAERPYLRLVKTDR